MTCSVVLAIKQVARYARYQMIMICTSYPMAGCSTVGEAWSLESLAGLQGRRGSVGAVPGARLPGTRGKHGSRVMRSARHRALEIERMKKVHQLISEPLTGKAFSAVAGWRRLSMYRHIC
ncbi:hypothetical protein QR685DRAFT_572025 [Neurospora intermedia]|uniref:Uncharacterized protein n=1 Tax=Neurospora intermedia TaxID=5142 RepID=A0ABR3DE75_NEUIN